MVIKGVQNINLHSISKTSPTTPSHHREGLDGEGGGDVDGSMAAGDLVAGVEELERIVMVVEHGGAVSF
ncbi:hypothetical protein Sjap_019566 [Stephania japonica]|uniref:Uncharacterized protein n=1 Tax=Stephania japonica TaxID=461633 RepID=A0AAP0HY95_9MAGN